MSAPLMDEAAFLTWGPSLGRTKPATAALGQAGSALFGAFNTDSLVLHGFADGQFNFSSGFGHYQGLLVDDPLFGTYAIRLELRTHWEHGVWLSLAAYPTLPDATDADSIDAAKCLARNVFASMAPSWREDSFDKVRVGVAEWLSSICGGMTLDEMAAYCAVFRRDLDAVLAP